jgi:Antitoxin Xre/MbcA/ParS C-terminal toxin-binding domain/Antitoxin Xre-like helix-turn-helix domain
MQPETLPNAISDAALVSRAAIRAADRLNLSSRVLARTIGVSDASISRMRKGDYHLEKNQKPFELAVLFLRLYRSLDAVVGGDEAVARAWLNNANSALDATPVEMIQTVSGLTHVIQYLDARRAVV